MSSIIVWYTVYFVLHLCKCEDILIIKTDDGVLQGKYWTSFEGRQFAGFTGIPYAKPPIGQLRFMAPEPMEPWDGILNASGSHHVCPQINIYDKDLPLIGDEDCLYLNVYTPTFLPADNSKSLPVMFYIYGGSFEMGGASPEFLGPHYLLDKDIVLVIVNYRLGALGFLSTSDEFAPGNNGLKDQTLALKWVNGNIAKFGGDPNKVTIFGNSAGGYSVHLHTMSPLSTGLFHNAIVQSAAILIFIGNNSKKSKQNAEQLGKLLNCSTTSSVELLACLRNISIEKILEKQSTFVSWDGSSTMPFLPTIESPSKKAFLTEDPIEIIKSGQVSQVPIIMGFVSQEAAYVSSFLNGNPALLNMLNTNFDSIIPPTFQIQSDKYNSSKKIRNYYFGDANIADKKIELARMYSDGIFLLSHNLALTLHARFTNLTIYQYLFDYRGSKSYSSLFGDPDFDYGVCHTDELFYLLKLKHTFPNYVPNDGDIKMIKTLTELWTNFAITGSPTLRSTNVVDFETWTPTDKNGLGYYHIKGHNDVRMKSGGIFLDRAYFWRNLPIIEL